MARSTKSNSLPFANHHRMFSPVKHYDSHLAVPLTGFADSILSMKGPEFIETTRLVLRRPIAADAEAIYAVCKRSGSYQICWLAKASVHRRNQGVSRLQRSRMEPLACRPLFGRMSERSIIAWEYQVDFRIANRRGHGVRARSRLGHGYATEALAAVLVVARQLRVRRLYAICHANHQPSIHVLEKCGFVREDLLAGFADFLNLGSRRREDCLSYAQVFTDDSADN